MAYELDIDPQARQQIHALPVEVRPALDEAMTVIGLVPWNGPSINARNPDGEVRQLIFGPGGYGTVTYLILEDQQRVDVLLVQWVG